MRNVPRGSVIRSGVFELDPESGELPESGVQIRLRPQQARISVLLASRPEAGGTPGEIREHIRGSETFIEFGTGLTGLRICEGVV